MNMTVTESLPDARRRQAGKPGAAAETHEHRLDDVIQMVGRRDDPHALRRTLLREERQARRAELGLVRSTGRAPLADGARDGERRAPSLHETRVVGRGRAPHAMVEMPDPQARAQRLVGPEREQQVDRIRPAGNRHANRLRRRQPVRRQTRPGCEGRAHGGEGRQGRDHGVKIAGCPALPT